MHVAARAADSVDTTHLRLLVACAGGAFVVLILGSVRMLSTLAVAASVGVLALLAAMTIVHAHFSNRALTSDSRASSERARAPSYQAISA
jgi:hypothetical protein